MVHFYIVIYGLVQGVGFRRFTRRKANLYKIVGWVRNKENGTVEIDAEGLSMNMVQFLSSIKTGPKRSKIERVEITQLQTLENYQGFKTKY